MPKCYQSSWVHGTWTAPIIHEVMIICKKRKSLLLSENKLMSIKMAFDLECIESHWEINNILTYLQ